MIGDHLRLRSIKRLKLFGNLMVLSFYLLCVIQSRKWIPYSTICAPLVASVWIWGLSHYRQPKQHGKIANFGCFEMYRDRIIPRPPPALGFQRGSLIPSLDFDNQDGLLVPRETPPPGGTGFQYASSITVRFKKGTLEPPPRVSRYKKISDPENWIV